MAQNWYSTLLKDFTQAAGRCILILIISLSVSGAAPVSAGAAQPAAGSALQTMALRLEAPSACPSGGCAAGQRLTMHFEFDPSGFIDSSAPNVKICAYTPTDWGVPANSAVAADKGEVTDAPYTAEGANGCTEDNAPPSGYSLTLERLTTLSAGAFADALNFSFRLGPQATGNRLALARVFVRNDADDTTPWVMRSATSPILQLTGTASTSYVANDAASCGTKSPCYLNSGGDRPDGISTGLKDAVDAAPSGATVVIVGNYTIKSNTVLVDKDMDLTGMDDATLTYAGPAACTDSPPMLLLKGAISLHDLNINDGNCTTPDRVLVRVDTSDSVFITSNDLYSGNNAIEIADNTGPVTIRYNDINGNAGYALYDEGSSNNAPLDLTANNLSANQTDNPTVPPVECAAGSETALPNRQANHNYWGSSFPGADKTHCLMPEGKRLGMSIAHNDGSPGVKAQQVLVQDSKNYAFDDQIAYQRTGGDNDFDLVIVNHGYASAGGPPFTLALGGESPSPCSNYWDVFLPVGRQGSGTLELFFKYDKTAGCVAAINSSLYCDQTTDSGKYPLFWYDPATDSTKWWDTTGLRPQNLSSGEGQVTKCDMTNKEMQVSIDGTGRPDLITDLAYAPFMVGVPVIRSFLPLARNQQVDVTWTTNNEPDISGFYVLRRLEGETNFSPISDLIPHTGTALVGRAYSYPDTGRTNGVRYYYRLQVVRTDGVSIYSAIESVVANVATITPTLTQMATFTRTVQFTTPTRTFTRVAAQAPTRQVTPSPTRRLLTPSATFLVLPIGTNDGSGTPGSSGTPLPPAEYRITAEDQCAGIAARFNVSVESLIQLNGINCDLLPVGKVILIPQPTQASSQQATSAGGTPIAMLNDSPTPSPSSTAGLMDGTIEGRGNTRANPWLSLLFGILTGMASISVLGGWWYFRLKR
jgi:hypothetical protein